MRLKKGPLPFPSAGNLTPRVPRNSKQRAHCAARRIVRLRALPDAEPRAPVAGPLWLLATRRRLLSERDSIRRTKSNRDGPDPSTFLSQLVKALPLPQARDLVAQDPGLERPDHRPEQHA